jgi:hypothetical protein
MLSLEYTASAGHAGLELRWLLLAFQKWSGDFKRLPDFVRNKVGRLSNELLNIFGCGARCPLVERYRHRAILKDYGSQPRKLSAFRVSKSVKK